MTIENSQLASIFLALDDADEKQLRLISTSIISHLKLIQQSNARSIASQLKVGCRVQIFGGKPRYLNGQTGVVKDIKASRAHILLDQGPQGKFRSGIVITPFTLLEVI